MNFFLVNGTDTRSGMNTSTVPTWASETSKSHKRGKMVMIEGAMITGGICLSYWVDFGFSFLEPSTVSWRFPIAFQIFFALILLVFILELPESPRVSDSLLHDSRGLPESWGETDPQCFIT
jgi:MFS family permease